MPAFSPAPPRQVHKTCPKTTGSYRLRTAAMIHVPEAMAVEDPVLIH